MEELQDAAKAYYNNATEEQQSLAMNFFRAMDLDGSGHVSFEEFTKFLRQPKGLYHVDLAIFRDLDRNGDGQLDCWEVFTIYYAAKSGVVSCDTCQRCLAAMYFTCVTCFESTCDDTFDLCVGCYTKKAFSHEHRLFWDNHVLLRSKRNQNQNPHNVPEDIKPQKKPTTDTCNVSQMTITQEDPEEIHTSNVSQVTKTKKDPQEIHTSNVSQITKTQKDPLEINTRDVYQMITIQKDTEKINTCDVSQMTITQEDPQEINTCNVSQMTITQEDPEEISTCDVSQITIPQEDPQEISTCDVSQFTIPEVDPEEISTCDVSQFTIPQEDLEEISTCDVSQFTIPEVDPEEILSHASTALDAAFTVLDVATTCSIM